METILAMFNAIHLTFRSVQTDTSYTFGI